MTPGEIERKVRRLDNDVQSIYEMLATLSAQQARQGNLLTSMDGRLADQDARFDAVDARLDGIDAKLTTFDTRFDTIDAKLDALLHQNQQPD